MFFLSCFEDGLPLFWALFSIVLRMGVPRFAAWYAWWVVALRKIRLNRVRACKKLETNTWWLGVGEFLGKFLDVVAGVFCCLSWTLGDSDHGCLWAHVKLSGWVRWPACILIKTKFGYERGFKLSFWPMLLPEGLTFSYSFFKGRRGFNELSSRGELRGIT